MEELHTTRVHTPDFSKLTIQTVVSEPQPSHDDSFDLKGDENDAASSDYDSFDEHGYDRPTERWAPLGAAVSPTPLATEPSPYSEHERLRRLEEEQEQLNSSLLALTTHFAQVQFRLKQIVSADSSDREKLLKELEEFAFKGIPDVNSCQVQKDVITNDLSDQEHEEKLAEQRERQRKLITQLKSQLEDLETYAYEARVTCHNAHFYKKTGDAELPTSKVMEKQRVVLEELRHKLDLDLENFDKLSAEELRDIVDHAVQSIVNPAKVKEKLVEQLKTQIVDLERFIEFLQGEASSPGPLGKQRCICPVHHKAPYDDSDEQGDCCGSSKARSHRRDKDKEPTERQAAKGSETTTTLMKKALTVLQIYIISQLGCGSREFKRNLLKRTTKGNHWGDLRAKLEVAINHTLEVAQQQQQERRQWQDDTSGSDEYTSDTDESEPPSSPALTQCVRKELAMAIRDLMQHGLMEMGQSSNLVQFGCFPNRSAGVTKMIHAWDLLVKFYHMKHGREYNESPARMLSQSFHLDIVGGKPITAKQTLLGAIDTVLKSHAPHRRTADSHFKAFICLALNERKLVTWLRLLFRTQTLIDMYYQDWSYMARTGFEDGLQALERLLVINFHLPVDLAVRPFSNIRDAF